MDNKMMGVAKLLGVELEEEFRIKEAPITSVYKISEEGLVLHHKEENWWEAVPYMLALLLTGERKIDKLPWLPTTNDTYYYPCPSSREKVLVGCTWMGSSLDLYRFNHGLVFRTSDEANEATKKMLAALQEENNDQSYGRSGKNA